MSPESVEPLVELYKIYKVAEKKEDAYKVKQKLILIVGEELEDNVGLDWLDEGRVNFIIFADLTSLFGFLPYLTQGSFQLISIKVKEIINLHDSN